MGGCGFSGAFEGVCLEVSCDVLPDSLFSLMDGRLQCAFGDSVLGG